MFDLEQAIAAWRRQYRYRGRFLREDLDELERHLRDHIAHLQREDRTPEQAFQTAVQALGDSWSAEAEYRKVYWRKLKRRNHVLPELKWRLTMWTNYLKITLRHLRRHKGHTFINVTGLTIGMACCLLIALYVMDEWSYDRYHENADRIVRLVDVIAAEDFSRDFSAVSAPMGPALVRDYPEVEQAVRFYAVEEPWLQYQDARIKENRLLFTDASVFEVFTWPLVVGDPATALREPNTIVLTETMALKYFGEEPALGSTLTLNGRSEYTVTGVMQDIPSTSHFQVDFLASFATLDGQSMVESWWRHDFYTYLLLRDARDVAPLAAKLPTFIETRMGTMLAEENRTLVASLQPLTTIHLHSNRYEEIEPNGDATALKLLSAIGLFILLIACFNFVNLSTARTADRAQEVGIRKVLGAMRSHLMKRFLGESVLICVLSATLALALVLLLLPAFNDVAAKQLMIQDLPWARLSLVFAGFALFIGLLAGAYPAFFMSAIKPMTALKHRSGLHQRGVVRKGLVVLQFTLSIGLILGTGIVSQQLDYLRNKNLGFDKEQVAILPLSRSVNDRFDSFKAGLLQNQNIRAVTRTSGVPGLDIGIGGESVRVAGQSSDHPVQMMWVDYDFEHAFGLDLIAGRSFSDLLATDSSEAFILNETAVQQLGLGSPEEALGQRLAWRDQKEGVVIGVVADFHVVSLHQRIDPLVIHIWPQWVNFAAVNIAPGNLSATMNFMEARWQAHAPDNPYEVFFLDSDSTRCTEQKSVLATC